MMAFCCKYVCAKGRTYAEYYSSSDTLESNYLCNKTFVVESSSIVSFILKKNCYTVHRGRCHETNKQNNGTHIREDIKFSHIRIYIPLSLLVLYSLFSLNFPSLFRKREEFVMRVHACILLSNFLSNSFSYR